jgi:hypothetical protein
MASSWLAAAQPRASSQAGSRLARVLSVIARVPEIDLARYPWPGQPDCVENDYYRFLNHPRD